MASYLDLVNKVVYEGASEMDALSIDTWNSAEAGRRNYPRFKRNVADAWKMIQMARLQWEFNDVSVSTIVSPRLKIADGNRAAAPAVGSVFEGMESGFRFTVTKVVPIAGSWVDGDAEAQIEFVSYTNTDRPRMGESFKEISPIPANGVFTFLQRGSYDFREINPFMREIMWDTIVAQQGTNSPNPLVYVPWDNWLYMQNDYTGNSTTSPSYVSQDYQGNVVFYPQSLKQFRTTFVASTAPQILTQPDDVPANMPEEFHDWIAWEALDSMARFDKNPDLLAYSSKWTTFYRNRAEVQLMPLPSWARSKYSNAGVRYE